MSYQESTITFFKNTPMYDFQNTIHFKDNATRDSFFTQTYSHFSITQDFNMVRDRYKIRVPSSAIPANGVSGFEATNGFNYCTYVTPAGTVYYAFITQWDYVNDSVYTANLTIDVVMTWTQGTHWVPNANMQVRRQHLSNTDLTNNLLLLRTNDDVLSYPLVYKYQWYESFADISTNKPWIVVKSSTDWQKDAGTITAPTMSTSRGTTVDGITSPLVVYLMDYD